MSTPRQRLDPVGRLRAPRRSTILRTILVAVLLLTAAGVLYSGAGGDPATPAPAAAPPGDGADPRIPDGMVGVPVPLDEPAAIAVLRDGDRVDLLAVPTPDGEPVPLAGEVMVLAIDRTTAAVLLSLTPEQAHQVVSAPAATRFAVIVRG